MEEFQTDTLARRLKLARKRRGMKQVGLAAAAGVTQSDISKLENGTALATSAIARLARALNVPSEWLEENVGPVPDWTAPNERPTAASVTLSEAEVMVQLRPEWRELILAYDLLLPDDREELARPLLKKAADVRRYNEAALSRQSIQNKAPTPAESHQPAQSPYLGPERRGPPHRHTPERRASGSPQIPSRMTHRKRDGEGSGGQQGEGS